MGLESSMRSARSCQSCFQSWRYFEKVTSSDWTKEHMRNEQQRQENTTQMGTYATNMCWLKGKEKRKSFSELIWIAWMFSWVRSSRVI